MHKQSQREDSRQRISPPVFLILQGRDAGFPSMACTPPWSFPKWCWLLTNLLAQASLSAKAHTHTHTHRALFLISLPSFNSILITPVGKNLANRYHHVSSHSVQLHHLVTPVRDRQRRSMDFCWTAVNWPKVGGGGIYHGSLCPIA